MPDRSPTGYQQWLLDEYAKRKRKNSSYSYRAFSAHLGLSSGALSELLTGKRPLTVRLAKRLADRLALSPDSKLELLQSLFSSSQPNASRKTYAALKEEDYHPLDTKTFQSISDWYYYPLLCLSKVEGARFDTHWLARRLDLPVAKVKTAITRLLSLGLIQEDGKRYWESGKPLTTKSKVNGPILEKFYAQNLTIAKKALKKGGVSKGDFSTITVPIHTEDVPMIKDEIKRFRRRLAGKLMKAKTKQQVYTLAIQFFPVDSGPKKGDIK